MVVIKKSIGYILLLSAILLSFATFYSILKSIVNGIIEFNVSVQAGIVYSTWMIISAALLIVIIFFMFKISLKLIQFKNIISADSIDDIGV